MMSLEDWKQYHLPVHYPVMLDVPFVVVVAVADVAATMLAVLFDAGLALDLKISDASVEVFPGRLRLVW